MKRFRTLTTGVDMAIFKDIAFPRTCPGADYDISWNDCFHDRNIFAISSCYESAVLFAARRGAMNQRWKGWHVSWEYDVNVNLHGRLHEQPMVCMRY